jgi:hypothetical protein
MEFLLLLSNEIVKLSVKTLRRLENCSNNAVNYSEIISVNYTRENALPQVA